MDYSEPLDLSLPSVKLKTTNHNSETDMPLDLSKRRPENPPLIQTGPFTNTNINMGNFSSDHRPGIHKKYGNSSLPYLNSAQPRKAHSCVPVRNNYSDSYEDELVSSEQPFDFSFRYGETKNSNNGQKIERSNNNYKGKKSKSSNESFTIYAETDLDQPTDYSLRYAENDSDSDSEACDNAAKTTPAEFVGDTVKTYCTEGTPYETPLNFSTSTSMSDLRISEKNAVGCIEEEKTEIKKNIQEENVNASCSKEKTAESEDQPQTPKLKSEFNSGLTSPEKPMNYCDEGTPGYFSRVSSFGSLNSAAAGSGEEKLSGEKHKCEDPNVTPKGDKMQQKLPGSEVKVVKFENIVNYCEETPLMFSRSSSLGSLGSIEQHSMHDDRSSVISDFSRLTSGIISPSEIPDSPTQTVPPSPKQQKSSEFGVISRNSSIENRRHSSVRRSLPTKSSIFEDDVTKFKEESTPAQFSVATSLSSLTIDDNDEPQVQDQPDGNCGKEGSTSKQDVDTNINNHNSKDETNSFQNPRDNKHNRCFLSLGSGPFPTGFQDAPTAMYNASTSKFPSRVLPSTLSAENTTHVYNTEDTPAVLSRNGSISELSLSTLSMLDEEEPGGNRVYLSENSSESSGGHINILADRKQLKAIGGEQQAKDVWIRREPVKNLDTAAFEDDNLPPFSASGDECLQFAVEDSPAQFSLRSSLSHLTIESENTLGIQNSFSNEAAEPPHNTTENIAENTSEQNVEDFGDVETQEEHSIKESSSVSKSNDELEVDTLNGGSCSVECDTNPKEIVDNSCDNYKSYELKCDDSRCNSIKKRKWKWKWQFGSEDAHQSESGESTPTDRQSFSNHEEFDQGRRNRVDGNNSGSLDASFRKKKWWKWKFGSKEKDSSGATQNVPETIQNCFTDDEQIQKSNSLDEKESDSKEGSIIDTRNRSKRWKWKWKLNFKEDDNSKTEKVSLGLSKLKHHVSPENKKEPLCIHELSCDLPKERSSILKFATGKHPKSESDCTPTEIPNPKVPPDDISKNISQEQIPIPVRRKLDTPEPSDSEQSVIIEEVNEYKIYENSDTFSKRNLSGRSYRSTCSSKNEKDITGEKISDNNSNYAALVEECIQLGMPKKINAPNSVISQNNSPGPRTSNNMIEPDNSPEHKKEQCNASSINPAVDRLAILEECIQLGMQKKCKESSLNRYIEDNVNSPKTNYKSVPKGSSSLFVTNKSFDVISMKELKTREIRTMSEEHKLIRTKSTNFDSSSLNRLTLSQPRKNDFNSNDNILRNIPQENCGKIEHSNMNGLIYHRNYDGRNSVSNKPKIYDQEIARSQGKFDSQANSVAPKNAFTKSSTARGATYRKSTSENQPQVVSTNICKDSLQGKITTKPSCPGDTGKNPDFAALIEECIQLGMPKRKESSEETLSPALSPSLVNEKLIAVKGWPEYLSRVAGENKSASLPKKSSTHVTTSQSYCASNEDFTAADAHIKKNLVVQNSFAKYPNSNSSANNGFGSDILKKRQEKTSYIPSKISPHGSSTMKEFGEAQGNEESLYANADETRSYLNSRDRQQLRAGYKSPSPKRSPTSKQDSSIKGMSSDEENNAMLIEDCVRLGMPVKKLQEFRRYLNRNKVKEVLKPKEVDGFVRSSTPRIADSEDGAVYANTTERYSTFRSATNPEFGPNRNGEKQLSPKPCIENDNTHPRVLPEKKIVPPFSPNNNDTKIINGDPKNESAKSECQSHSKNNQDFAAIIEECIQLGMPKRKDYSRETLNSNLSLTSINSRSNSVMKSAEDSNKVPFDFNRSATLPKGSSHLSSCYSSSEDFSRTHSLKKNSLISQNTPPNVRKNPNLGQVNVPKKDPRVMEIPPQNSPRLFPQKNAPVLSPKIQSDNRVPIIIRDMGECVEPEVSHQEEEAEESLYVNVSKHAGYSRSTRGQHLLEEVASSPRESTKPQMDSNFNKKDVNSSEPNYSALVEECIKLGMPSKKICDVQKYLKNISSQGVSSQNLGEASITPGSDCEEMAVYANTSERYSSFQSSISESGLNRYSRTTSNLKSSTTTIPVGEFEIGRDSISTSSTVEKALQECVQLGWPKKRETERNAALRTSNISSNDGSTKKTEKSTSKNVNVASVARNMQIPHLACSRIPTMATGAGDDSEPQSASMTESDKGEDLTNMERNGFNSTNYSLINNTGCSQYSDDTPQAESEISFAGLADVDVKLLDPQLVLESLEKYTAKLISEAELILHNKNNETFLELLPDIK